MRTFRQLGLLAALGAGLSGATTTTAADAQREALLSAALVYNIARFSAWPEEATRDGSFDVCIDRRGVTADAFGTIAGKPVAGVPVRVVAMVGDQRPTCDVAYFARTRSYEADLSARQVPGTLTVGRAEDFLQNGGAVRVTIDGRPRFAVDMRAARGAGVRPSAKLLRLAEEVVQ